jgi:hypothetical protein
MRYMEVGLISRERNIRSLRIDRRPYFKKYKPAKSKKKGVRSLKELNKQAKAGRLNDMRGNSFERDLTKAYNVFFRERGIKGYAYRLKQAIYADQLIDVLVDSPFEEFYQAVECKSMKVVKGKKSFGFHRFSDGQIENENRFIDMTGRRGILAIEMRHDKVSSDRVGKKGAPKAYREAYLVPWEIIWDKYLAGEKSITFDEIRVYPMIKREYGLYKL